MTRNQFLKLAGLSGIALAVSPQLGFQNAFISYEELIGKGHPELFGDTYKLRKEAFIAFEQMKEEAMKIGISIKAVSSYRDFNYQNRIWQRKYKQFTSKGITGVDSINKIIEYSTIPGTSRHHWGTDIDIVDGNVKQPNNLLHPRNFETTAPFGRLKQWMNTNANSFGFYLVYTNEPSRKGFNYEPWHYSYKPLSQLYLSDYRQLKLLEIFQNENIVGSHYFTEEFLNNYWNENILDINPALL